VSIKLFKGIKNKEHISGVVSLVVNDGKIINGLFYESLRDKK